MGFWLFMGLGANEDDDVVVYDGVGDGGECNSGGKGFGSISCSICLDLVTDNGDRSWAKLQCGHQFHLGEFKVVFWVVLILWIGFYMMRSGVIFDNLMIWACKNVVYGLRFSFC